MFCPLPHVGLCPLNSGFSLMLDLDFTFLEMNPFTLVDGKPYPLDMRGELDDTAAFKNFKKCVSSFYIGDDLIWILVHFFGQISGLLMLTYMSPFVGGAILNFHCPSEEL